MLESSSFDFRSRQPQELLIKFLKYYNFDQRSSVAKLAYKMSLDLYRTWAPLKQTTTVMVFACMELSGRLIGEEHTDICTGKDYERWSVERVHVMETMLDLLELYTHHRTQTVVGGDFPLETFLKVRIPLNQESEEKNIPRFSAWKEEHENEEPAAATNGVNGKSTMRKEDGHRGPLGLVAAMKTTRVGERGREGTVRFILNPDRERDENAVVAAFEKD
jgi:CTD kinase subunit beta